MAGDPSTRAAGDRPTPAATSSSSSAAFFSAGGGLGLGPSSLLLHLLLLHSLL
jgi:hypothetical protein